MYNIPLIESGDLMEHAPMPIRRGGRTNSIEMPLIPAAELPPLARALQRWITTIKQQTDIHDSTITFFAHQIGVDPGTFNRVYKGTVKYPEIEFCEKVQAYFAEQVRRGIAPPPQPNTPHIELPGVALELAGHGSDARYTEMRDHARHIRPDLTPLLEVTATPAWRETRLLQRRHVDRELLSGAPWDIKLNRIAQIIRAWLIDPGCELPYDARLRALQAGGSARA